METDCDNILKVNVTYLKKHMKFKPIPKEELWRVDLIKELVNMKQNNLEATFGQDDYLNSAEIDDLIMFATTS